MMSEFNFKSQVCTDRFQSERLLALGLKKETADIVHFFSQSLAQDWTIVPLADGETARYIQGLEIPAWSLGRLIEICGKDRLPISFHKKGKVKIMVNHIHPTHDGRCGYNYYDSIIDCIDWLIKEGYFNKEYLV